MPLAMVRLSGPKQSPLKVEIEVFDNKQNKLLK